MSDLIANRYELGEVIGSGGMSEVYLAKDTLIGREVAVKMLRPDLARDINFRERFRREAINSGQLNHPAIVATYDTGEMDRDGIGTPYIVMELVRGRTLRDIIREDGRFTPTEAARTLVPVCEALQASHDAGIIHRDIKPANIMITNTGAVKIMDFGIARAIGDATSAMTQTSAVIGTAQYLSPEQARGKNADARSDVYALGCVLYEMVTGQPPFQGDTPFSVAYQHVQEDPQAPSELIGDLSPTAALNVDAVILTALAKHPGDRYQSATELADDLRRLERGAVTEAARHHVKPIDDANDAAGTPLPTAVVAEPTEIVPATPDVVPDAAPTTIAPAQAPAQAAPQQSQEPPASYQAAPAVVPDASHRMPEEKKSRKGLRAGIATLAVLLLAGGGYIAYDYLSTNGVSTINGDKQMVTVPALENVDQAEALTTLQGLGLQVSVSEEANPNIARGKTIRTNPAAGSSVQSGTTITLFVSSGKEVTEVPDVRGLNTADAGKALEAAGLLLDSTVREAASEDVAEGSVMEQSPAAGSQVSKGTKVTITVSTGPEDQRIPVVTGMKWEQAAGNLTALGFEPIVQYVDSLESEGTVLSVAGEGTNAPAGSQVQVQVSNGALITVPNLARMNANDALAALRAAGWTGSNAQLVTGEPVKTAALQDVGLIAAQDPVSGGTIRKDGNVTVRIYEFDLLAINLAN